ncbi:MAG: flippase-like domain-containing protein [Bacteroidetes bacterium]|nr:flippase-like domain-containing protein [Bacteroidota bacterium]
MLARKKIFSILIKALIGVASLSVIYFRLKDDFTHDKLQLIYNAAFSGKGILFFALCLLLMPVNWGIEAYKWKLITTPVEKINYATANKSIYSGICLGNLAPGRATEFLAKIIFFSPANRPKVTVLHFINGMFQFSITIVVGLIALLFKLNSFGEEFEWIAYITASIGVLVIVLLILCIYKIDFILHLVQKKISKEKNTQEFNYTFSAKTLFQLSGFSLLRYAVFFSQLVLLIYLFHPQHFDTNIFIGIALYFLITSVMPMISVLEAAIRAAIALVVFKNSGIENSVLALATVLLWFINIVIPSAVGYYFLVKMPPPTPPKGESSAVGKSSPLGRVWEGLT